MCRYLDMKSNWCAKKRGLCKPLLCSLGFRMEAVLAAVGLGGLLLLLALSGCASPTLERHSLDGWAVVMGDQDTITRLCRGRGTSDRALGCALVERKIIYCPEWDFYVCGHELHHITHGRWHE